MANVIEVIKLIGTIISTIIGATTLCGICIKPLRKAIIKWKKILNREMKY